MSRRGAHANVRLVTSLPRPMRPDLPAASPLDPSVAETQTAPLGHRDILRILFGLMLAMLLGALEQTIVATALPTIGEAFGDFANLSWVVTAYLIAATVATPLYGKLSDIYGRRVMLLISVSIFSAASAACALAPSLFVLILARGLQGLGGGGLISLAQTIIADVVSPRERGRYQAYIACVFAFASIAGPVLGGVFAQHIHWSLIFWINLPLGLLAFLISHRALGGLPRHERRHDVDLPGAALMASSSILLLLALGWGGTRHAWTSPEILSLLGTSAALGGLFVWRIRRAAEPFLPPDLLADKVVGRGTAAAFMTVGSLVGQSIFVPLYFETVRGMSASQSGLALIPLMGGVVCGSLVSGRTMVRLTHYKWPALAGSSCAALALGVLSVSAGALSPPALGALLAVAGIGVGTTLPVCTVSVQNAVARHRMGTATGVMNFFRQLGGALVVAVLGAVLLGTLGRGTGLDAHALSHGSAAPLLATGFDRVFATLALVQLTASMLLWTLPERPLRGASEAAPLA